MNDIVNNTIGYEFIMHSRDVKDMINKTKAEFFTDGEIDRYAQLIDDIIEKAIRNHCKELENMMQRKGF